MKIMFINSVVDYGSTGKIVRDLANSLKADGHQVLIAFGRKDPIDLNDIFDISDKQGLYYHLLMTRIFDRHGLASKRATEKLINKIKSFQPEVIHLHNLHGYYLHYPLLMNFLKTQAQIKIVWTLHDLWSVSGSVAHFSYYGCKVYDQGCKIANNPRVYPKSSVFLREEKNFNLKKSVFSGFNNLSIVTVSNWQKEIIKNTFLNEYPIYRIYNGIDFNKFQGARYVEKTPNTILGTNTYWNDEKGLNDFLKLAKILPQKYSITLAGLTKRQIKQLPTNIKGLEIISNQNELIDLYAKSSLFLNLSVQETMGMTTVEALACGTPTIVYDQTAIPEIIDDSVGQVVKAGDIQALALAIETVNKRSIKAEVCYEFALEHYNKTKMVRKYQELYFK